MFGLASLVLQSGQHSSFGEYKPIGCCFSHLWFAYSDVLAIIDIITVIVTMKLSLTSCFYNLCRFTLNGTGIT